MKKYELTQEETTYQGRTLYRIRYLIDIPFQKIKVGDLGGWIEKESNLSHEGDCSILNEAMVMDNGFISGNATIYEKSKVQDNVQVSGFAMVQNKAFLKDMVHVKDKAVVKDSAIVSACSIIQDEACVRGASIIGGDKGNDKPIIGGEALIFGSSVVTGNPVITYAVIEDSFISDEVNISGKTHISNQSKISKSAVIESSHIEKSVIEDAEISLSIIKEARIVGKNAVRNCVFESAELTIEGTNDLYKVTIEQSEAVSIKGMTKIHHVAIMESRFVYIQEKAFLKGELNRKLSIFKCSHILFNGNCRVLMGIDDELVFNGVNIYVLDRAHLVGTLSIQSHFTIKEYSSLINHTGKNHTFNNEQLIGDTKVVIHV